MGIIIGTAPALRARRRRHELDVLVVANRLKVHACGLGELSAGDTSGLLK
jgi:hypothetical protein